MENKLGPVFNTGLGPILTLETPNLDQFLTLQHICRETERKRAKKRSKASTGPQKHRDGGRQTSRKPAR